MMLRQLSFFLILSLATFLANAEDDIRYYNVEVILFEHLNTNNQDAEDWKPAKQDKEITQAELTHQLGQPYVMEAESVYDPELMFTVIPEEQHKLIEEAKKIEESTSRRLLMHTAWRQPGLSYEQAIRVVFKHQIDNKLTDESIATNSTIPLQPRLDNALTLAPPVQPYIEGSIKVMLARYLHVDTDIMYFAKHTPLENNTTTEMDSAVALDDKYREDSNELTLYQMKQLRRRIRSTELHYLDHPVIGMLLTITPYEKPGTNNKVTAPQ